MNPAERERYSRQILFAGIGAAGQQKLLDSHVAIVGCGALGSFHAEALARAGVGQLTIIDRDYVEPSNLQRQWLFEEADAEAQGGAKKGAAGDAVDAEEEDVEIDESLDDAAFIQETEEEDTDVTEIIGGDIEDKDET